MCKYELPKSRLSKVIVRQTDILLTCEIKPECAILYTVSRIKTEIFYISYKTRAILMKFGKPFPE